MRTEREEGEEANDTKTNTTTAMIVAGTGTVLLASEAKSIVVLGTMMTMTTIITAILRSSDGKFGKASCVRFSRTDCSCV